MNEYSVQDSAASRRTLREALGVYGEAPHLQEVTREVLTLAASGDLTRDAALELARANRPERGYEGELVDAVLNIIEEALRDHHLTADERIEIRVIRHQLGLSEGALLLHRRERIADLLIREMKRLLADKKVDAAEALYQVDLQEIFDLSYDEYCAMTKSAADEIISALVNEITADGRVSSVERDRLQHQLLALDMIYEIPFAQIAQLQAAGFPMPKRAL